VREKEASRLLTNQGLVRIKAKAVRRGVWFRLLSRADRAVLDLTIRCVERVRSPVLAKTISKIISKVLKALEANLMMKAEKFGRVIAGELAMVAERWGNKKASWWIYDKSFLRFLGVNALNT
jgi:hypothetical protein